VRVWSPAIPSTVIPALRWKARTASEVAGPAIPSIGPW
jgi:hypothetical protein